MNFALGVEKALFRRILVVVRSAVGVLTLLGYSIKLSLTLSGVQ
jgi:hypothetical protein